MFWKGKNDLYKAQVHCVTQRKGMYDYGRPTIDIIVYDSMSSDGVNVIQNTFSFSTMKISGRFKSFLQPNALSVISKSF